MTQYLPAALVLAGSVSLAVVVAKVRRQHVNEPVPPHAPSEVPAPHPGTEGNAAGAEEAVADVVVADDTRRLAAMSPQEVLDHAATCAERFGPTDPRTIAARRAATDRISRFVDGPGEVRP